MISKANGRGWAAAMVALVLLGGAAHAADAKIGGRGIKSPGAEKLSGYLLDSIAGAKSAATALPNGLVLARDAAYQTTDKGLVVEVVLTQVTDSTEADFARLPGTTVLHVSEEWRRVTLEVSDPSVLLGVAARPDVVMAMPATRPVPQVGAVSGLAEVAHYADHGSTRWGVTGRGQKVGILSDSFNSTSGVRGANTTPGAGQSGTLRNAKNQLSGDLPGEVEILRDVLGSDEGAGMAELVHDIAPGAAISFYTAFVSESAFADGITALRSGGATVVVDDVIYYAEPMFEHGIIARSAQNCVDAGVPYLSSSGNGANYGMRFNFRDLNTAADNTTYPPDGNDLHRWDNGTGFLPITVLPGAQILVVMQWNQPFQSLNANRGAQVDLDLFLTAEPTVTSLGNASQTFESADEQGSPGDAYGDALEITGLFNPTPAPVTVYLAINHFHGTQDNIPQDVNTPLDVRLAFFSCGGCVQIEGLTSDRDGFGGPTMYGHSNAPGVLAVGAVAWYDTPAFDTTFGPTRGMDAQDFTSRGGDLPIYFDASGNLAPTTVRKPDIAAVNGNNTTFFGFHLDLGGYQGEPDGFPNFFGTSASAPNAAAIVALMRELVPTLTPADIRTVLEQTSLDVVGRRGRTGWDDTTGHGLINALAALDAVGGAAPDRTPVPSPSPTPSSIRRVDFDFAANSSEGWSFVPGGGSFTTPRGSVEGNSLVLASLNNNTNTFGFYQSPLFRAGVWQQGIDHPINATTGSDSLLRARYRVTTNATALDAPTVRMRAATADFAQVSELQVGSATAAFNLTAGITKTFDHYFPLPDGRDQFRLFVDLINMGGVDSATGSIQVSEVILDAVGVSSLGFATAERTYDFRSNQQGFVHSAAIAPSAGFSFLVPGFRATESGLAIGPAPAPSGSQVAFGFWNLQPGQPARLNMDANRVYRARFTVSSNATRANQTRVPSFRLRANDSTGNLAALIHVESTGSPLLAPAGGDRREFDLWFEGRGELTAQLNELLWSFDYILPAGTDNDANVSLQLERISVVSYAKPSF